MKSINKFILISLLGLAFGTGCAKKFDSAASNGNGGVDCAVGANCAVTPPDGGRVDDPNKPDASDWGHSGELNFASTSSFQDFYGSNYTLNNLKDRFIFFDLQRDEDTNTYFGNMHLLFKIEETTGGISGNNQTTTKYASAKFITGIRETDVQFNKVYVQDENGTTNKYFVAFFEEPGADGGDDSFFKNWPLLDYGHCDDIQCFNIDQTKKRGAILIVIDHINDSGLKGKIYYKNWRAQNPQPHKPPQFGSYTFGGNNENIHNRCWHISAGPYQCQEFIVNGKTRPDLGIKHNLKEFKLLGNFEKVNSELLAY